MEGISNGCSDASCTIFRTERRIESEMDSILQHPRPRIIIFCFFLLSSLSNFVLFLCPLGTICYDRQKGEVDDCIMAWERKDPLIFCNVITYNILPSSQFLIVCPSMRCFSFVGISPVQARLLIYHFSFHAFVGAPVYQFSIFRTPPLKVPPLVRRRQQSFFQLFHGFLTWISDLVMCHNPTKNFS